MPPTGSTANGAATTSCSGSTHRRAQASVDAGRPFAWEHFLVKEVTPTEVVFSIGAELYEARIEDDTLTLTGTSFRGTRVLFRGGDDLRGTSE